MIEGRRVAGSKDSLTFPFVFVFFDSFPFHKIMRRRLVARGRAKYFPIPKGKSRPSSHFYFLLLLASDCDCLLFCSAGWKEKGALIVQ
jgi:hypothetical protein